MCVAVTKRLFVVADAGQKRIGALVVEFGEHVVEQQQRRFDRALARHRVFGHFQGQHRGALLSLRTVGGQRAPVERQAAGRRDAVRQRRLYARAPTRPPDAAASVNAACDRLRRRRLELHVGIVFDAQRLGTARKARVRLAGRLRERRDELRARQHDLRAGGDQLAVVDRRAARGSPGSSARSSAFFCWSALR